MAIALGPVIEPAAADDSRSGDQDSSFVLARREMVFRQIEARGITDPGLLAAMLKVERHRFVPDSLRRFAYNDHPLPIGEDQTISQPYIVALMTALLDLDGDKKVLEIGTGSGYQAAILAELADSVFTIEIVPLLAERSARLLKELGYENITTRCGDGYAGWEEQAPFDAIIVTCAPPEVPKPLLQQLAEGGRMVIPVGDWWQELVLIEKKNGKIVKQNITPVRFVPMTGEGVEKSGDDEN
jgi:protein-L-isoaspartate(D-aspartate) O-methyltransferase